MLPAEPHGLGPGQLLILSGGHAHPCPQSLETLGGKPPHPAIADDQHPGAVDGDGQMLHGQLDGPLRRGHGVGHRQLLPGEVVVDGEASLPGQLLGLPVHPPAAEELPGGELV